MFKFSFFSNTNYSFEGKKEGEEVILFLYRHWYTLVSKIVFIIAAAFLPFIALIIVGQLLIQFNLIPLFAVLWAAYYLFLWYSLFYVLTMYILDTWLVTNMRIIDSQQDGFFSRRVSELSMANIQDVSFDIEGAIPTMMHFGDIEVQTAGKENRFLFTQIPDPQKVKDEIMKIASDFRRTHGQQENI